VPAATALKTFEGWLPVPLLYWYADVPPATVAVMLPFADPQLACELAKVKLNAEGCAIVIDKPLALTQPFPSVTVTE
jgi:hypothetical protein